MDDILNGGTSDNHQRAGPEIVAEVADGNDPAVQALKMVLDDVSEQHGHDEYEEYLVENLEESGEKGDVGAFLDEGKADGHEESGEEVGKEGVGGHLFE